MSAIAGVYLLNGDSVDEKDLKRMNDSMPHRGPDGSGLWHDGSVGLAHQMLWTTPESLHEKLPFEADGLVITSDSRIDNREELLPELGLSEVVSDSEVILKAYGRWGKSCVDRLLGDFAFVIWDKAKEEMFCARDHMGVRPFYYYYMPGEIFAFATEIKALFAWGVPRQINEVRIGDYLLDIEEDKGITFYKDIIRLKPANFIAIKNDDFEELQYWALDPKCEIKLGSDEEYEKAFRDIFKEAVRCRLRSAFPIGFMLSGGLDSSSIVCMARKLKPKSNNLDTFSIIFDTLHDCDERSYLEKVINDGNLSTHLILGDKAGPLENMEKMLWHLDQPSFGGNLYLYWPLAMEVHAQNVRVLLDGVGGDSTVSHGWTYITELAGKWQFISLIKEIRIMSRNFAKSPSKILFRFALYPFIPDSLSHYWKMLHSPKDSSQVYTGFLNLDFIKKIAIEERIIRLQRIRSKPSRTVREYHWRDLSSGIHPLMNEEVSNISGAFSFERRSPFYDKRVVNL